MKLCRALGLTIGIATFQREVDDAAHIGGTRLVRRVLGAIGAGVCGVLAQPHVCSARAYLGLAEGFFSYV